MEANKAIASDGTFWYNNKEEKAVKYDENNSHLLGIWEVSLKIFTKLMHFVEFLVVFKGHHRFFLFQSLKMQSIMI